MDLSAVKAFLGTPTPLAWCEAAAQDVPTLLIDHANCEKKAAGTAMRLLFQYSDHDALQIALAQLAREELLHYEQVRGLIRDRGISWRAVSAGRYADTLRAQVRTYEPARVVDLMIVGALVEARSCERFAALVPYVDAELGRYYTYLLRSESRHFEMYLSLARALAGPREDVDARIATLRAIEQQLIAEPDEQLRFHSGPPVRHAA